MDARRDAPSEAGGVIFLFYGCLILGATLLVSAVRGRLTVPADRIRSWRAFGLVAAAAPGLGPLLGWLTGTLGATWPFPLIAIAYLVVFAVLALGILGWLGDEPSRYLRRSGYLCLLLLGALPSWVLLVLAPAILVAAAVLVEPRQVAEPPEVAELSGRFG